MVLAPSDIIGFGMEMKAFELIPFVFVLLRSVENRPRERRGFVWCVFLMYLLNIYISLP